MYDNYYGTINNTVWYLPMIERVNEYTSSN